MYIVRVKGLVNYEYIYLVPVVLSAIVSVRSFIWNKEIYFRLFSILLLLTILVELFAISWKLELHQTKYWNYSRSNLWIYNAFLSFRHVFTLLFIYFIIETPQLKQMIKWSIIPFILFFTLNYVFVQTPFYVNSYTIILSSIILVVISVAYFKQILEETKIIKLSIKPEFWICLGGFIYYTGTLPFFILFNKLITTSSSYLNSFLFINDTLNIVMYSMYLIGFLCLHQNQK
ncbi:conserved membrane hypothetical protein [Tenacibaculum aestuarii]